MAKVWTTEEKEYLFSVAKGKTRKELAIIMTEQFGDKYRIYTKQSVDKILKYNHIKTGIPPRYQKGYTPHNKGVKGWTTEKSFKKGRTPYNKKPIGYEYIRQDGLISIKVDQPNKWMLKQVFIWELYYGKKPKGHKLIFADGDKTNCEINNLILVTEKELMKVAKNGMICSDAEVTKAGVNLVKLINLIKEKEI